MIEIARKNLVSVYLRWDKRVAKGQRPVGKLLNIDYDYSQEKENYVMANYSIYFSPTGGTKKVADILIDCLCEQNQEIDLCKEYEPVKFNENDLCVVSVPSYGGRVPAVAIERLKNITANGTKVILNCVYGNRAWDDTLSELQDTLEQQGFVCVAAIAAVAEHSVFRQFGAGRPDAQDVLELQSFAELILKKIAEKSYKKLELDGSHGTYKEYNGVPFKPEGNEQCGGCGACVKECPVGAISMENPKQTNKDMCISCMRCVSVCPRQARSCNVEFMKMMADKMAVALSGRKKNHIFL